MTSTDPELRDSLLAAETWDQPRREWYERNLERLLDGRLSVARRWLFAGVAAPICLSTAFACIFLVTRVGNLGARAGLPLVALYGLFCAGLLLTIAIRGSVRFGAYLRFTGMLTSAAVLLFALAALLTANMAPDRISSIQVVCLSLVGLVPASLGAVLLRIRQAETVILCNSLRVESRLLELRQEKDDRRESTPAPTLGARVRGATPATDLRGSD